MTEEEIVVTPIITKNDEDEIKEDDINDLSAAVINNQFQSSVIRALDKLQTDVDALKMQSDMDALEVEDEDEEDDEPDEAIIEEVVPEKAVPEETVIEPVKSTNSEAVDPVVHKVHMGRVF